MEDKLLQKIATECGSNNVQVPLKVPEKIHALIEHNSKNSKAEFIRGLIYEKFLPELLKARLFSKSTDWLSKEDFENGGVVIFFSERINDLKEIIALANLALDETIKFQEKVQKAEIEFINGLSDKISKEVYKKD